MQLSVVIVSYNVQHFLELCLQSVIKATTQIAAEIIVVDNNSTDATCDIIVKNYPTVKLIKNNENVGFSKANNLGVAQAEGDYVLILNPDTVVTENTFTDCLAFAKSADNLGALAVKLIDGTGHFLPESKRNIPTPLITLYKMFGLKTNKHAYYAQHLSENETGKIEVLVGAFMFMKRSVFTAVGGFDTDYFMYGEDIDLSYKLVKNGYQNYYLGNTSIIHFKGESTKKDVKYLNYFYGAMQLFYKKHFKSNFFFGLVLKLGIFLWYSIKYFQLTFKKSVTNKIEKAIYLGSAIETLNGLKSKYSTLQITDCKSTELLDIHDVDVIFIDTNSISYRDLIKTLESLKNKRISFRIITQKPSFILGSDSAIGRGEVVLLD